VKKAILFVVDNFYDDEVTAFVKQYSKIFLKRNFEVIIIGHNTDKGNPYDFSSECKIVLVPTPSASLIQLSYIKKCVEFFLYIKTLHKVYSENSNIVIVHSGLMWSTLYTIFHPYTWRKRRTATYYGSYYLEISSTSINNKFKIKLFKVFQKIGLYACHKIICPSVYAKNNIFTHFGEKIADKTSIIPGMYELHKEVAKFSKKIRISFDKESPFVLLNFGSAEPRKGILLLLQTIALLKNKIPVKAYIATPFEHLHHHHEIIEVYQKLDLFDTVHFIHRVNYAQKQILADKSDLFIMPSTDLETSGLAIIEAIEMGLPVAGTPVGAIPEILSSIDQNLIAKSLTAQSLANTIQYYYELPYNQKMKLRDKIEESMKKRYSVNTHATNIFDVITTPFSQK
jgi:glycosyltransferase involved in cell wall biosynthesis